MTLATSWTSLSRATEAKCLSGPDVEKLAGKIIECKKNKYDLDVKSVALHNCLNTPKMPSMGATPGTVLLIAGGAFLGGVIAAVLTGLVRK